MIGLAGESLDYIVFRGSEFRDVAGDSNGVFSRGSSGDGLAGDFGRGDVVVLTAGVEGDGFTFFGGHNGGKVSVGGWKGAKLKSEVEVAGRRVLRACVMPLARHTKRDAFMR